MKFKLWSKVLCCTILILGAMPCITVGGEEQFESWYEPHLITNVAISDGCRGVAFLRREDSLNDVSAVILNGESLSGGHIRAMILSPDGRRAAWAWTLRDVWYILQNGKSQASYDELIASPPRIAFSPDSKHLAFAARWDKQWFIVLDGKETSAGSAPPDELQFSPDSQRLAYVIMNGGKKHVVVDGQSGDGYIDIQQLQFSADSNHIAYLASIEKDRCVAVIDGIVRSEAYTTISGFRMTRDAGRFGFSASRKVGSAAHDEYFVILDGMITPSFNDNLFGPVFSDDGKHAMFVVTKAIGTGAGPIRGFNYVATFDAQVKDPYRFVQEAVYSPDSTRLAMITCGNFSPEYHAIFRYALTVDGKDVLGGDVPNDPGYFGRMTFSPDGKRIACARRGPLIDIDHTDFRWSMLVDGESGSLYRSVAPIVFSPDSKHVAYAAQKENTWIMVLDGKELPYELLRPSVDGGPDGRWKTTPVPEINWPPVLPQDGPRREDFDVAQIPYCFDKENQLTFFGVRDGKLFRVTMGE